MEFRLVTQKDFPLLKHTYKDIIADMHQKQIKIWDEIYPCESFKEDIGNNRLYALLQDKTILSAFALCDSHPGETAVTWNQTCDKVLYLERLGVNANHLKQGMGSFTLKKAMETAQKLGAESLRLFVVDINQPAINLYRKNGFFQAVGIYEDMIPENVILRQLGFEIPLVCPLPAE